MTDTIDTLYHPIATCLNGFTGNTPNDEAFTRLCDYTEQLCSDAEYCDDIDAGRVTVATNIVERAVSTLIVRDEEFTVEHSDEAVGLLTGQIPCDDSHGLPTPTVEDMQQK